MLVRLPPKLLSCRLLEQVESSLGRALGCSERHVSVGIVTCDQDDSLYAALDHATKFADVDVVYAKSLYAGSAHASGPFSGAKLSASTMSRCFGQAKSTVPSK